MTDLEIERLCGLTERDYLTWVESYAGTPGVEVVLTPEIRYRHAAGVDHEYLSAVFGAHLDPAVVAQRIAEMIEVLGAGGRAFIWTIWPSDGPLDLAERLIAAGFDDLGSDPLMTLHLSARPDAGPAPPDLVIREATTVDEIRRVGGFAAGSGGEQDDSTRLFVSTFERLARGPTPRLRLFGGEVDGEVVTAGGLFTGSGVAGIYAVATAEAQRGRGYGRALTAAAIEAGRAAGFDTATLMASEMGLPVYRRLGFVEVGRVRFLRWPGMKLPATVPGRS